MVNATKRETQNRHRDETCIFSHSSETPSIPAINKRVLELVEIMHPRKLIIIFISLVGEANSKPQIIDDIVRILDNF